MSGERGRIPPRKWTLAGLPAFITSYYQRVGWHPHSEPPESWFVTLLLPREKCHPRYQLPHIKQYIFIGLNRKQESANIWKTTITPGKINSR